MSDFFAPGIARPFDRKTFVPERGVVVSTILLTFDFARHRRPDCETMAFAATDLEHITSFTELYCERHEPEDDLDAEHERIVAGIISGELELSDR